MLDRIYIAETFRDLVRRRREVKAGWELRPSGYTKDKLAKVLSSIVDIYGNHIGEDIITPFYRRVLVDHMLGVRLEQERTRVLDIESKHKPVVVPDACPGWTPGQICMGHVMHKLRFREVANLVLPQLYLFLTGADPQPKAVVFRSRRGERRHFSRVARMYYQGRVVHGRAFDPVEALVIACVDLKAQLGIAIHLQYVGEPEEPAYDAETGNRVTMSASHVQEECKWYIRYGPGKYDGFVFYSSIPQMKRHLAEESDC